MQAVIVGSSVPGQRVLATHERHERLSLSGKNPTYTLQNVQVPCQVNERVNRKNGACRRPRIFISMIRIPGRQGGNPNAELVPL
jgi:hypothetical protein